MGNVFSLPAAPEGRFKAHQDVAALWARGAATAGAAVVVGSGGHVSAVLLQLDHSALQEANICMPADINLVLEESEQDQGDIGVLLLGCKSDKRRDASYDQLQQNLSRRLSSILAIREPTNRQAAMKIFEESFGSEYGKHFRMRKAGGNSLVETVIRLREKGCELSVFDSTQTTAERDDTVSRMATLKSSLESGPKAINITSWEILIKNKQKVLNQSLGTLQEYGKLDVHVLLDRVSEVFQVPPNISEQYREQWQAIEELYEGADAVNRLIHLMENMSIRGDFIKIKEHSIEDWKERVRSLQHCGPECHDYSHREIFREGKTFCDNHIVALEGLCEVVNNYVLKSCGVVGLPQRSQTDWEYIVITELDEPAASPRERDHKPMQQPVTTSPSISISKNPTSLEVEEGRSRPLANGAISYTSQRTLQRPEATGPLDTHLMQQSIFDRRPQWSLSPVPSSKMKGVLPKVKTDLKPRKPLPPLEFERKSQFGTVVTNVAPPRYRGKTVSYPPATGPGLQRKKNSLLSDANRSWSPTSEPRNTSRPKGLGSATGSTGAPYPPRAGNRSNITKLPPI